jgi:parallel beta-helix repeat protein
MGNPTAGIYVTGSSNTITENNLTNNICSIILLETSHDLIVGNNITKSSEVAFDLYESSNNKIYHNNIINNTNNVEDDSFGFSGAMSINIWDDGYPAGGNYWGFQTGNEIGNTGISDKPYQIKPSSMVEASSATMDAAYVKNTDRYPLVEPFNASFLLNYPQEMTPPKISVLSPLKEIYSEGNVSLVFSMNKEANWIGYSLDGEQNVTITGNTTLTNMTIGLHTITVFANDTFGEMDASQTISFTIAKPAPFQTTIVAVASGTLAVIVVGAGLLVYFKKHKR